ncbi:MAG TPA: glycosyltransferase family 1 protein [Rhodospirillales bacterium]|nr:glycosyltransferase family 1 protein [Rhodospirillales bacterium]
MVPTNQRCRPHLHSTSRKARRRRSRRSAADAGPVSHPPLPVLSRDPPRRLPAADDLRRHQRLRSEAIHIATEGPLGWATRRHCLRRRLPFSTSFHTRFPEYIQARWRVPLDWSYRFVRTFHEPASHVMVATATIEQELVARGFRNITRWTRGVDTELFRPRPKNLYDLPRPVSLYVGRIAVEKSVEDFLRLELPGSKVLIGNGPMLTALKGRYPQARFLGAKVGEDLAAHYAAADVFVFPSRTDTFGLVLLEALASGVPVAAYPVPGPLDVIATSGAGCLDEDLGRATGAALAIPSGVCRARAEAFSWDNSVRQFLANIAPIR